MKNNEEMKKIIDGFVGERKTLLLHSCCAPCSTAVVEKLNPYFDITIFYYNPNIFPREEYEKRRADQERLCKELTIGFIEGSYNQEEFTVAIKGKEDMPEKSERCKECYQFRLEETAKLAKANNFDFFTTTLSVSPYKNAKWINEILKKLEDKYNTKCLPSDFKKDNGYLRSIELAKKHNLYRQGYCGCRPINHN